MHASAKGVLGGAVNRGGHEGDPASGIEFWGGSFVADPSGNILAKAGIEEETLIVACDTGKVDFARTHWPFLRDRRVDAYQDIGRRYIDEG